MRDMKWLRFGIASLTLMTAGLGGIVACSDDDTNGSSSGTPPPTPTTPPTANPPPTGSSDAGDGGNPSVNGAKLVFVNAATAIGGSSAADPAGGIRICFKTKLEGEAEFGDTTLPPLPNLAADGTTDGGTFGMPGLFIGTGGPIPQTGASYQKTTIRPYVFSAAKLAANNIVGKEAATPRCAALLADEPDYDTAKYGEKLVLNEDYWQLPDVEMGKLQDGKSYLLALTGCTGDSTGFSPRCGPVRDGSANYVPDGEPGNGNLQVTILELDTTTTAAAGQFAVAFAHLSPAWQGLLAQPLPPVNPILGVPPMDGDAGRVSLDTGAVTFSPAITAASAPKSVPVDPATGFFAINGSNPLAPEQPVNPLPLNQSGVEGVGTSQVSISALSGLGANGIVAGKVYTFVFVGDPAQLENPNKLRAPHYIAFDNAFVPPQL